MINKVTEIFEDNVWLIEHEQNDSVVIYDKINFDSKVKPIYFTAEYYDYNKPHKVNRNNKQHFWRLFTCMFGVCEFNLLDETIELSRENKKQLLVRPLVNINYFNISGKSVVHVKSGMPIK